MMDSAGKEVARRLLYQRNLQKWLSDEQLSSGRALLLLGEDARELEFLDERGFPRSHITCVENDYDIWFKLVQQNLGTNIQQEDVVVWLRHSLHLDYRYVFLNIDVSGSFRANIDEGMTSVLLYCCRNPSTVVATYHSIGRDKHTLWEGAKSFFLFCFLAPEQAQVLLARLRDAYRAGGYTKPVLCALRDFFWLRSLLENNIRASFALGDCNEDQVRRFFEVLDKSWDTFQDSKNRTLQVHHILSATESLREEYPDLLDDLPKLRVELADIDHVVYKADHPWSQRCYFTKFGVYQEPASMDSWIHQAFGLFGNNPFTFINREGDAKTVHPEEELVLCGLRTNLQKGRGIYRDFKPRSLPQLRLEHYEKAILRTRLELEIRGGKRGAMPEKTKPKKKTKKKKSKPLLIKGGKLTKPGRNRARELAEEGLDAREIIAELKLTESQGLIRSLAAFAAIARRPHRFSADGNGTISEYGKSFIRALAKRKITFEEVMERLPEGINEKSARSTYSWAQRQNN